MKNNKSSLILITVFCFFIGIISILYAFMPKSDYSETEKRKLQEFPEISFASIKSGEFSEGFEKYLADHTPLRKSFVAINTYYEYMRGNNGSNGVYLGKDGWLIEKPFDKDEEKNIRLSDNLNNIKSFVKNITQPVYFIAVPTKGYIYNDMLPSNALEYNDKAYLTEIQSNLSNKVKYIDITSSFEDNKNDFQLFYKTDHHWTSEGAFIAYKQFCLTKNISAPLENSYNIKTFSGFYGTSYSTSLYTLTKPVDIKLYINKATNGNAKISIYNNTGKLESTYSNLFFNDRLKEADMYQVYLDGNHARVDIETGNDGGTLLIFEDSFGHCFTPFIAENYSKIIKIDLRYYLEDVQEIIENENIDEVLFIYGLDELCTGKIVF